MSGEEVQISQIEDAIIKTILDAQGDGGLGYKLKTVKTYGGEFADSIDEAVKNFPAALVIFSGAQPSPNGGTQSRTRMIAKFGVICGAKNLRSEEASRHGDANNPGSYKIVYDICRLLHKKRLGLAIAPFQITAIDPLYNDKSNKQLASVYGVEIQTEFDLIEFFADAADLDDFKTFHSDWDIPPHGNVETPLPADDTADATDHVTLET